MTTNAPASPRLLWLRLWRAAWIFLAVLALGRFALSAAVFYQDIHILCTGDPQVCRDSNKLMVEDISSLQADGITPEQFAIYAISYRVIIVLVFAAVGLLIFVLKQNDPAALFMALSLLLFGANNNFVTQLGERYPQFALALDTFQTLGIIGFAIFFCIFPNGRLVPRRMWMLIVIWSILLLLGTFGGNIIGFNDTTITIFWTSFWLISIASQIYRYVRVSNLEERRQTRWVIYGIVLIFMLNFAVTLIPQINNHFSDFVPWSLGKLVTFALSNLSLTILPISIAIAIFRSRLWDIDVIIRKTVVYALLSGMLGVVYFGGVALLQGILTADRRLPTAGQPAVSGPPSAVVIVATTLTIAALFNPLRRRLQETIDRRFYRQKYDAEKALAEFATAARSEAGLAPLMEEMIRLTRQTLQPEAITVWLSSNTISTPTSPEKNA